MENFSFIIFFIIWFVLQKWILPKMGVSTWMSPNTCRVPVKNEDIEDEKRQDSTTTKEKND